MKTVRDFEFIALSMLLALGVPACDKTPGPDPAESAGKQLDSSAHEAGKKLGETVDKVGEKISDQSVKAGTALDDALITTKVKASILAEDSLKSVQIGVNTVKGEVTLSGSADSMAKSELAISLARAVAGVTEVKNKG